MTLKQAKSRGFTIVELLIVIVVIAILAAITIVAYNGIQNRAKTAAGTSLASNIAKKAEAWNTIQNSYPTYCQLTTNTLVPTYVAPNCTGAGGAGPIEAKLDVPTAVVQTNPMTATAGDGGADVAYVACANNKGGTVLYWDYARSLQVGVRVGSSTVYGDLGTTAITAACA